MSCLAQNEKLVSIKVAQRKQAIEYMRYVANTEWDGINTLASELVQSADKEEYVNNKVAAQNIAASKSTLEGVKNVQVNI